MKIERKEYDLLLQSTEEGMVGTGPYKGMRIYVPYFIDLAIRGNGATLSDDSGGVTYYNIPISTKDEEFFPELRYKAAVLLRCINGVLWKEISPPEWMAASLYHRTSKGGVSV